MTKRQVVPEKEIAEEAGKCERVFSGLILNLKSASTLHGILFQPVSECIAVVPPNGSEQLFVLRNKRGIST